MIERALYKQIKRMNREEMTNFLSNLYRDGAEAGELVDKRIWLSDVLNKTKGIGPVMYDRVMETAKENLIEKGEVKE